MLSEARQEIPDFLQQYKGMGTRPMDQKKDDALEDLPGFVDSKLKIDEGTTKNGDDWESGAPKAATKENDGDGWGNAIPNTRNNTTRANDGNAAPNITKGKNNEDEWETAAPKATITGNDEDGWGTLAPNTISTW